MSLEIIFKEIAQIAEWNVLCRQKRISLFFWILLKVNWTFGRKLIDIYNVYENFIIAPSSY